jgi:hypothetical protein
MEYGSRLFEYWRKLVIRMAVHVIREPPEDVREFASLICHL